MALVQAEFWTDVFVRAAGDPEEGKPYAGVRVYHFASGTSTNKTAWVDAGMTATAPSPVVGDNAGRASFYGDGDYRLVIKTSVADGDLTLYDFDNVKLTAKAATLRGESQGTTYPAATSANRGALFAKTDGLGNITELGIQKDTAFSALFLLGAVLSSIVQFGKGADLTSAGTVTLGSDGNFFDVAGTVGITGLTSKPAGTVVWLRFLGVLPLTYNATSLKLIGNQDYTTRINDVLAFLSLGNGNWEEVSRNGVIPVGGGGTGLISATLNGVLLGQGGNAPLALTAPGGANQLFAVGGGGGAPAFLTLTSAMIPNGLIAQAHLATNSVGTPQLRTATGVAAVQTAGFPAYNNPVSANVTMNDYAWFPSFTDAVINLGYPSGSGYSSWGVFPAADPGNTIGRVKITAYEPYPLLGVVQAVLRWRYLTASDNPDVWVIADPETGGIVAARWSDDPAPGGPPLAVAGHVARQLTAADFEQLSLPAAALTAAQDRIKAERLKPNHLAFRAVQAHAHDDAPAQWLMSNMQIQNGSLLPLSEEQKAARHRVRQIPKETF